jgi:hypothetical protein
MYRIVIFISLFSASLSAQKAITKVSISTRHYYHYEWTKEMSSCENSETVDTASLRCIWIISYSYPYFKTSDVNFTQLINKAVQNTFDHSTPSSKFIRLNSWKCLEDKPGEDLMSYRINLNAYPFLSFIIYKDFEPSGLGNGFRHDAIPFTFDIENKKLMTIGDVIKDNYDTTVHRIIISYIKKTNPALLSELGEINNPELFHPFSTLGYLFAMTKESIVLYYPLSFGGKSAYEEIEIKFKEYPQLFDDSRLLNLH